MSPLPVRPTVGRIVHYVSYGTPSGEYQSECRAAIIVAIGVTTTLCVLNPSGIFFNQCVHSEQGHRGGTWHWPERVDEDVEEDEIMSALAAMRNPDGTS